MTTWGVLRLPDGAASGGFATGEGAVGAALAAHVDGAVALAHGVPLTTALASLPEQVTIVVELDAEDAASGEPGPLIATLLAALDADHVAVVAARPMADALKRVEGDVVVEGLSRDGLLTPCLPHVYRRAELTAVLAASGGDTDGGDTDAIGRLLDAGHAVRVVPADGDPVTVRRGA
jgi:2-C-methyl-D-erythritol 4-phosphate cytidylyltransferase